MAHSWPTLGPLLARFWPAFGPLLARFAEALGLPRLGLIHDLQYENELCLYKKILPGQTGALEKKRKDPVCATLSYKSTLDRLAGPAYD